MNPVLQIIRQLWAVSAGQPRRSDFHRFCDRLGIFKLDAEVADGDVHFRVAQQTLNRPQIA